MNNRNLLSKIIKFALILGSSFFGNHVLAENITSCPKDYDPDPYEMPKPGIIKVNVRKSIVDANNNESLREHLALLKLNAVENYSRFIKTEITSTPTKYGGERYTEKFDTSWDFMKKSIASMEEK